MRWQSASVAPASSAVVPKWMPPCSDRSVTLPGRSRFSVGPPSELQGVSQAGEAPERDLTTKGSSAAGPQ